MADADLVPDIVRHGFDRFAPGGGEFINPAIVQADLERLHRAAAPVRKYTNQVVAHRQRRTGEVERASVSFDDLNHALDELGATTKKYYRLRHPGTTLGGLTPIVGRAFLTMFEKPWYIEGTPLPSETDLG